MNIHVRPETPSDIPAIQAVLEAAFPTQAEARLVDLLRARNKALISLVAESNGEIVGHILFSPVTVTSESKITTAVGLAPVAVSPTHQNKGIGKRLIQEGLRACRSANHPFAVVLGEPHYYHQFGFHRASDFNLRNEYNVNDEFMVIELHPNSFPLSGGLVKYAPEFNESGVWGLKQRFHPASRFNNHQVIKRGTIYYDPSYGKKYDTSSMDCSGFPDSLACLDNKAVAGYYLGNRSITLNENATSYDWNGDTFITNTNVSGIASDVVKENPTGNQLTD